MLNTNSLKEEKFKAEVTYSFESVSIKRIHIYLGFMETAECHVHFCLVELTDELLLHMLTNS